MAKCLVVFKKVSYHHITVEADNALSAVHAADAVMDDEEWHEIEGASEWRFHTTTLLSE